MDEKFVSKHDPAEEADRRLLIARMQANPGSIDALEAEDALVRENIGLVHFVLKKFNFSSTDREDAESVGIAELRNAAKKFHLDVKVRFATYAVECINGGILMFRDDEYKGNRRGYRITRNMEYSLQKAAKLGLTYEDEDGVIAEKMQISAQAVRNLKVELLRINKCSFSMNQTIGNDGNSNSGPRRQEIESSIGVIPQAMKQLHLTADVKRVLGEGLSKLTELQRRSFVLIDIEGLTAAEVAAQTDISASAANQSKRRARRFLQRYFEENGIDGSYFP